jgi:hypothetical protein
MRDPSGTSMRCVSVVNEGSMRSSEPALRSRRKTSSPSWKTSTSLDAVATAASSSSIWRLSRPARSSCPFVTHTSRAVRSGSVTGKPWWNAAIVTGTPMTTASATTEAMGLRARTQDAKLPTFNSPGFRLPDGRMPRSDASDGRARGRERPST